MEIHLLILRILITALLSGFTPSRPTSCNNVTFDWEYHITATRSELINGIPVPIKASGDGFQVGDTYGVQYKFKPNTDNMVGSQVTVTEEPFHTTFYITASRDSFDYEVTIMRKAPGVSWEVFCNLGELRIDMDNGDN